MDEYLLDRLKYMIYDLLKFNKKSQQHLSYYSVRYPQYYFSLFYFTEDEIEFLLNFPTDNGLYKDLFDKLIKDKTISNGEVCSSHDIAPLLCKIFNIKRGFDDKKFISFMKKFKGI